ncbi:MAG: transposase [Rhodomicrobium sp.]
MRGFGFIAAVSFLSEVGDLSRFAKPSQVMGYLGRTRDAEVRDLIPAAESVDRSGRRPRAGGIPISASL